ncbi:hypothetical protein [Bacteroides thetaiotaomicron]|uniref:hypothetical protein n=1 Tax=Bacteroides thetaiotaomicron TaxID=818 RepID=UPI0039C1D236
MENKFVHPKLGEFIEEALKVAHINISAMCRAIHMGPATYQKIKKREEKDLIHYERVFNYYYDTLTEEEFVEKMHEWALRFIRYKEKQIKENMSARKLSDE